ncbi:MAG: DMT family transporter [Verrucomicrobiales bacterium]|nr:DMT family transporter [Verrucomicrobiales bacterium]
MLLALAALWGGSFPFMRAAAPSFGPIPLIATRLVVAALVFLPIFRRAEFRTLARRNAGALLANGLLSAAVPFCLLAFSTLSLTAGFTSLLNALTPLSTAILAWVVWRHRMSRIQWFGLTLGLAGVAVLCWGRMSFRAGGSGWAIVTAMLATVCYGIGGNVAKRRFAGLPAPLTAGGTLLGASIGCVIPGLATWPATNPPATAWASAIVLGMLCTSVAYLLYFRLLLSVTATQVSSVTFLVPMFSILWGGLFLGESLTMRMLVASIVILTGTALANGILGPRRRNTDVGRFKPGDAPCESRPDRSA